MIKVAVIGTGYFSQYHYEAWSRIPDVSVEALVYGENEEKARDVATRYGVPQAYKDLAEMLQEVEPDLVDIVTPPESHLHLVEEVVGHGAAVIVQKPLAPNVHEATRIAELASNSTVVVHDNWRFKPWFRETKKLLDDGAFGELYNVTFRLRPGDGQGPEAYLDRQPYFQTMPRFLFHETGIHLVDTFRFLAGEVDAVTARLRRFNPNIHGEDAGQVILDFTSGSAGLIDGNRLVDFEAANPRKTMGELLMEGSKGQMRLDGYGRLLFRQHQGSVQEHSYEWSDQNYGGDAVFNLQKHVIEHLTDGAPLENSANEYLRNIHIEEAIYRSNETGERIAVADSEDSTVKGM